MWLLVTEGLIRLKYGNNAVFVTPVSTVKTKTKSATSLRFCKLSRFKICNRRLYGRNVQVGTLLVKYLCTFSRVLILDCAMGFHTGLLNSKIGLTYEVKNIFIVKGSREMKNLKNIAQRERALAHTIAMCCEKVKDGSIKTPRS